MGEAGIKEISAKLKGKLQGFLSSNAFECFT
jgi:hypothetical protein